MAVIKTVNRNGIREAWRTDGVRDWAYLYPIKDDKWERETCIAVEWKAGSLQKLPVEVCVFIEFVGDALALDDAKRMYAVLGRAIEIAEEESND